MTLHLHLSAEAEARLKAQAQAAGKSVDQYAASVLEAAITVKSIREISGPLTDEFQQSGMTDDELGDMLEGIKHEVRRERRKGA